MLRADKPLPVPPKKNYVTQDVESYMGTLDKNNRDRFAMGKQDDSDTTGEQPDTSLPRLHAQNSNEVETRQLFQKLTFESGKNMNRAKNVRDEDLSSDTLPDSTFVIKNEQRLLESDPSEQCDAKFNEAAIQFLKKNYETIGPRHIMDSVVPGPSQRQLQLAQLHPNTARKCKMTEYYFLDYYYDLLSYLHQRKVRTQEFRVQHPNAVSIFC
jgi:hypothetical protein